MVKMLIRTAIAALAMTTAAGIADSRPLKPEQEALIKPDGKPTDCIPINQIRSSRVRDDRTIDFYMTGKRVYRNVLPNACPSLGFEERFLYRTSISSLCSTDIITVLYNAPAMQGPSCGLGQFQPVTGAPR
jgi:hypothetical protein